MKRFTKKLLLSTLAVTTAATAMVATAFGFSTTTASGDETNVITGSTFEMVDGASIRMSTPMGLRFIARMSESVYTDLVSEEDGLAQKMGMFIVPYAYLSDESQYSNGKTGVEKKEYHNLTTKIDHVFYDSEDVSVVNKIYAGEGANEGYYCANGVIGNLLLENFSRDFVGIAYIATTDNGVTTYTYADFDEVNNVRNSVYVAVKAYEDYTDAEVRSVFDQYVVGAYLADKGMTSDGKTFTYEGETYKSVADAAAAANVQLSVALDKSVAYVKNVGDSMTVTATIKDGDNTVNVNGANVAWSSSDETVAKVSANGKVTTLKEGMAKITATFMGKTASCEVYVSSMNFENGNVPSYFSGSRVQSFNVVEMYGGKVLEVKTTEDSTSDIGVYVKLDLLKAIFADESVAYMAFDLKSGASKTGNKVYYHNDGSSWTPYENGSFDSIDNSFKTYYFTRAEFNDWVSKNVTNGRFVMIGGGLVCGGESFYIDNIRGITEAEKTADYYSFETGGVRTNNGNQPLFYLPNGGQWELGFSNIDSTTAKFTSEIVSDGNRAFTFTKKSGDTKISFNHNTDTTMEKEMRAAGYVTFDIYAPEGSNASMKWSYNSAPLKTNAWNTVYVQIDASNNDLIYLYDTTASTYVMDNIQFITEEEYFEKAYGFESGAATIRNDNAVDKAGVFYWFAGADRRKNVYSIAVTGSPMNPHFNSENVHDGEYSLAFEKTGNVNLQFRADSEAYAKLHNGFSFWIYSTIGINGTGTSNLLNGNDKKLNGGAGINVSKNTWTKITLTKDDIKQGTGEAGCKFLSIAGSTNGTYYIDGIEPIEYAGATFDAGIGTLDKTEMEIPYGGAYTLPTPTAYVDFLGWYDEKDNLVPMSGTWTKKGNVALTAKYGDKLSFEGGILPAYMTAVGTASIVEMDTVDGNKALRLTNSTTPGIQVTMTFLEHYFSDPDVEYIAFNAKTETGSYNNFRRFSWRSNNGGEYTDVTYETDNGHNKIKADSWKTYYFSRGDYVRWQESNQTKNNLISSGQITSTDSIYVDYIRPMTQEEYLASVYSFEGGSIRNDGSAVYMYMPNAGGTWQWVFTQSTAVQAAHATSDNVSDGFRAVSVTLTPNVTSNFRFNSASVVMAQDLMKTGYYAFDLYIPEGANASLTTTIGGNYATTVINEGGWRTVYSATTTFMSLTDTTGSTYAIDNMRSVTAEEYNAAINGFELGTGGIRQTELESGNVFYYYMNNGTDVNTVKASFNFVGGGGATLSNPHFSNEQAHSGTSSLAFEKTNGSMSFSMHVDSKNYATLKNGFTFWIYSTVGLNGSTASNFVDGNDKKFGENGIIVPANKWTQVTISKSNFKDTTFLKLAGSTAGTIYIDDFEALPYEPPQHYYNSEAESEEDGILTNLTLEKSTHSLTGNNAETTLPKATTTDTEDMSYYRFSGQYGLNDYLVMDFTGNNMPLLSFFTNNVTNTVYNHAQAASVKGWLVSNGMMTSNGLPYGGYTGAHANRITLCGPYMISYAYDDNGTNQPVTQVRTSIGSAAAPSPISMAQVNGYEQFRVIVGWVQNSTNSSQMNLRMIAWNLTTGEKLVDYNQGGVPKADWTGDIVLYSHFGMATMVDKVYPIVNGLDAALELYTPDMMSYKATWNGNGATLAAGTVSGTSTNVSYPTNADMSYIAFNGKYGSGDYVVFDMTGDNMPIVSFFNNTITNTIYNNNGTGSSATVKDANVTGWVWANGLYDNGGNVYGGAKDTNAHWSRLTLIGKQKIIGFDQNTNGFRSNLGSASDPNPLSMRALQNVTDTYRIIIGIRANGTSKVYVDMAAINMVTGAVAYKHSWEVSTGVSADGSIILYGRVGKATVLDTVLGIEENTTLDALIAKYAKDTDYSDEEAVELDRYAYSSITNGTFQKDGVSYCSTCGTKISDSHAVCKDFREDQATYDTYANAGFNILLPQTALDADAWSTTSVYMDKAYNAGLKVILTDWHIQMISTPIKVNADGAYAADSTYKPWVLASDVNADGTGKTAEVQAYLDALKAAGITVDTTRFKDQNALDNFLMSNIKNYKNHPAFYGVMLGDEPSYHNAYCYGLVYRSLKRIMPSIYVQYNLLPLEQTLSTIKYRYPGLANKSSASNTELENAYKQYVTAFLDSMGTDYIQYDDYPFKSAEEGLLFWTETVPYVDNTALRCIQIIAEIAKERDLAVKVVTQSCLMRSGGSSGAVHIRQITEADARWLNNYLLGFGVKQINYFTYWTKASNSSSGEWYEDGGSFVNKNGTTTAVYEIMKEIMAENTAFAPTISHFDYNASQVFGSNNDKNLNNDHISWSSSLTAAANFKYLTGVTTDKEYTLVTELYDAEKYNYMYMVMNTIDPYYGGTQNVTITLDSSVTNFYVYDQSGNRTAHTGNTYTVSLTAGQAIYIMPY